MGEILDKEKSFTVSCALLVESWRHSLRVANKAPRTIKGYTEAAHKFGEFLDAQGMPLQVSHIRREHIES